MTDRPANTTLVKTSDLKAMQAEITKLREALEDIRAITKAHLTMDGFKQAQPLTVAQIDNFTWQALNQSGDKHE